MRAAVGRAKDFSTVRAGKTDGPPAVERTLPRFEIFKNHDVPGRHFRLPKGRVGLVA